MWVKLSRWIKTSKISLVLSFFTFSILKTFLALTKRQAKRRLTSLTSLTLNCNISSFSLLTWRLCPTRLSILVYLQSLFQESFRYPFTAMNQALINISVSSLMLKLLWEWSLIFPFFLCFQIAIRAKMTHRLVLSFFSL